RPMMPATSLQLASTAPAETRPGSTAGARRLGWRIFSAALAFPIASRNSAATSRTTMPSGSTRRQAVARRFSPPGLYSFPAALRTISALPIRVSERRSGAASAAGGEEAMDYRPLGRTGLTVSMLGFGCGAVGGLLVRGGPAEQ